MTGLVIAISLISDKFAAGGGPPSGVVCVLSTEGDINITTIGGDEILVSPISVVESEAGDVVGISGGGDCANLCYRGN